MRRDSDTLVATSQLDMRPRLAYSRKTKPEWCSAKRFTREIAGQFHAVARTGSVTK